MTATFFESEEELQELTGLGHEQLWDEGFDLDDFDWGFVSDEPWDNAERAPRPFGELRTCWDMPNYCDIILTYMSDHGCGYLHHEYKSQHYYMCYHA